MRLFHTVSFSVLASLALATAPALAQGSLPAAAPPAAASASPAPLSELVKAVNLPYQSFTLANGLRVLVHTDRKAPVVAVSVWYGVGSKNEPEGKHGFAHLYEHLMFYGSQHVPGSFFAPLQKAGATDLNGSTWYDRTNYFETVPKNALDLALFLESDRMGYLLPAMTQKKLDAQRAVVENEKRQDDNQPYGLVDYLEFNTLYPPGHPYHHTTIGSVKDLNAATLSTVKEWFRDHYGPNNAVLALAGDIDLATAKAEVTKWFGAIPRGPAVKPVSAPVPTLPAPVSKTIHDEVATTRIYRMWAIPGLDSPDSLPLEMSATVLGGLASSRLDNALVRKGQEAVAVSAEADIFAQAGQFVVSADVKPGVDPAKAAAALDSTIAEFLANGPTADELRRAATVYAAGEIRGIEATGGSGGQAATLASGLLYTKDPEHFRKALQRAATLTPQQVAAVTRKWLSRPVFSLTVVPGKRSLDKASGAATDTSIASAGGAGSHPAYLHAPGKPIPASGTATAAAAAPDRSHMPAVGPVEKLPFPAIERATLSNGMKVYLARRTDLPVVSVNVSFDAGRAADPKDALGTQSLLLNLMDQGTTTLDSTQLAEARERLGAAISASSDLDRTVFQLDAVTPNLAPSLALLADYIRHPALKPSDLERVRAQQLAAIDAEIKNPQAMAERVLLPAIYGPDDPYGVPPSGLGDPKVVKALTREQLAAFHDRWFRPDKASIVVAGNTTMAQLKPLLEASFGNWRAPATPPPVKHFPETIAKQPPHIILVDRPGSPTSVIFGGRVLDVLGTQNQVPLRIANDILGGSIIGRMSLDLREAKGWSYGVYTMVTHPIGNAAFLVYAPVQTDKTGASIAEIRKQIDAYLTDKGATPAELQMSVDSNSRGLPGEFETTDALLAGESMIVKLHRPDDFYVKLPARYQALTTGEVDKAIRGQLGDGDGKLVYVVVGDAAKVKPQLDALGLPVEQMPIDNNVGKH